MNLTKPAQAMELRRLSQCYPDARADAPGREMKADHKGSQNGRDGMDQVRHPENARGPFFSDPEQCMACGAPQVQAPTLMGTDKETGQCFFLRQPTTPEEAEQACRAMEVSCCGAVRYSGDDPVILERLTADLARRARAVRRLPRRWWSSRELIWAALLVAGLCAWVILLIARGVSGE
jgi:hypothetical protein